MGRELKRVALDFNWPLEKVWEGYLNPHQPQKCPACKNGYSAGARALMDKWYGNASFKPEDRGSVPFLPTHPVVWEIAKRNAYGGSIQQEARRLANIFNRSWSHHLNTDDVAALLADGRLLDLTHTFKKGAGWQPKVPAYIPTPVEVNAWSLSGFGHDSINQWLCIKAECVRLGVSDTCSTCHGSGESWPSAELKQQYDAWEPTEPPTGPGYQIWETVSEGSPISPVFATPEELARFMAGRKWGGDDGSSYETWLNFINSGGYAPSLIMDEKGICPGVELYNQGN